MQRLRVAEAALDGAKFQPGYVETDPSGRYGRFREVLGKGAMKAVYRAFDEMLGMEVAWNQVRLNEMLKSPEELHRLYSEVHLLKSLQHDSIVQSYSSWVDVHRRTFNFITEMFTSGTLREYRQKYKRVNIRVVKSWARQILRGLAYLHSHNPPVIHRDLKCDNIFVNGHLGQVKIGDLGLAAILHGSHHAHSVIGTPEFMAPEVYEEDYDELVDIYSFGMCVLEMLTCEYPYSECSNPAQIYKKVTSGRLPNAFHRIKDEEAKQFVGKCLESASKRLPAQELLLDPFLDLEEGHLLPVQVTNMSAHLQPTISNGIVEEIVSRNTAMTITGTMNQADDETIFLKVQISNKLNGQARNIYFPFDIRNDTASDVAMEMVKELEIKDWDPSEIALMIEDEISSLIPSWKEQDVISYEDDHDAHYPFCYFSSPSSSHASLPSFQAPIIPPAFEENVTCSSQDWIHEAPSYYDDAASRSTLNYSSDNDRSDIELSPKRREPAILEKTHLSSRFCPVESASSAIDSDYEQTGYCGSFQNQKKLTRKIRSLLDVRSQLLHRSLVEEIHKRRLFKTIGAMENIGFQEPGG